MSFQALVLSLLGSIDDPAVRGDIATTLVFLADLYNSGRLSDSDLRRELTEVVDTVLAYVQPELLPPQRKEKTQMLVDQLMRAVKVRGLQRRSLTRLATVARAPSEEEFI